MIEKLNIFYDPQRIEKHYNSGMNKIKGYKTYNGKYKGIKVEAVNSIGNLICSTGRINGYRMAFYQGVGGTRKEKTWNKKLHRHDCCKSAVAWRHLRSCPALKKDIDDNKILETKEELLEKYFK